MEVRNRREFACSFICRDVFEFAAENLYTHHSRSAAKTLIINATIARSIHLSLGQFQLYPQSRESKFTTVATIIRCITRLYAFKLCFNFLFLLSNQRDDFVHALWERRYFNVRHGLKSDFTCCELRMRGDAALKNVILCIKITIEMLLYCLKLYYALEAWCTDISVHHFPTTQSCVHYIVLEKH